MRLGALFSGGKDSTYALHLAMEKHEVVCLITLVSENDESYMFHTPNIHLTGLQAEALGIPILQYATKGEKEKELADLKAAIKDAKKKFKLQGVVTGAVESAYQASRIQELCNGLGLESLNPLWHRNQEELVREIFSSGFEFIVSGVFAYPLGKEWLGRRIDEKALAELVQLQGKFGISPSGEGGEIETTVLDAPCFKKKLRILESEKRMSGENSGVLLIKKVELEEK